jgi:hypothetical protein
MHHFFCYIMKLTAPLTAATQLAFVFSTPLPSSTSNGRDIAGAGKDVEHQMARAPVEDLIATDELDKRANFVFSAACVSKAR